MSKSSEAEHQRLARTVGWREGRAFPFSAIASLRPLPSWCWPDAIARVLGGVVFYCRDAHGQPAGIVIIFAGEDAPRVQVYWRAPPEGERSPA